MPVLPEPLRQRLDQGRTRLLLAHDVGLDTVLAQVPRRTGSDTGQREGPIPDNKANQCYGT